MRAIILLLCFMIVAWFLRFCPLPAGIMIMRALTRRALIPKGMLHELRALLLILSRVQAVTWIFRDP